MNSLSFQPYPFGNPITVFINTIFVSISLVGFNNSTWPRNTSVRSFTASITWPQASTSWFSRINRNTNQYSSAIPTGFHLGTRSNGWGGATWCRFQSRSLTTRT